MTVTYKRWRKEEGRMPKGFWFQRREHIVYPASWEGHNAKMKFPERRRTYQFGYGNKVRVTIWTTKRIYQ